MRINYISAFDNQTYKQKTPNINFNGRVNIRKVKNNEVVKIFEDLVKIPSPPLKENKVADWILAFCQKYKIKAELDSYKNIRVNIPATDSTKKPLLLTAHMDVVGDDSPINIVRADDYIKTDGKRTLGADDKSGIAVALKLAKDFVNRKTKHGGLEILFTRDEELGMTGIINADLQKMKSKYVLVLDEAKLGRLDTSGAGYTTATLSLTTPYGGHSGMNIGDKFRLNAAKMIAELICKIPQGIYYKTKKGPVTSINLGTIIAGDIQNSASKIVEDRLISDNYLDFFMKNSVTNVINTKAMATFSIRSSSKSRENKLRQILVKIIEKFNEKYKGLAKAEINFEELMPIFERNKDTTLENVYKDACGSVGLEPCISTFSAGAETHILINKKNKFNERFLPVLLGVADIFDMHSSLEKINATSLKKGYELVQTIFLKFNSKQNS